MLFTNEFEHTIDAKRRLAIPAEIRTRMDRTLHGVAFYVTFGPNGALWLWPERTFEHMAQAMDSSLLPSEEMMDFDEIFFSQAERSDIDSAGRIRISDRLLEEAGISRNVVILGVKDHLEVRDRTQWEERRLEKISDRGDIMLRARRALAEQEQQQDQ